MEKLSAGTVGVEGFPPLVNGLDTVEGVATLVLLRTALWVS